MPFKKGQSGNPETQFKPGESGNPSGYKKGVENSKTRLLKFLELVIEDEDAITGKTEKKTVMEFMDARIIKQALMGDLKAYQEILDRAEGKVPNKSEITGKDGKDLIPTKYSVEFLDGGDTDTDNSD